uniref:Uncharacterized protein n=1 Tax=Arundo donax TaxID=35708 RepID=A0A0A9ABQ8_ARUDO
MTRAHADGRDPSRPASVFAHPRLAPRPSL